MKLDIPIRQFGGYIFDCDGTIADTMPIHYRAWSLAMRDYGGQFPEDLFYQWGGKPTAVIVEHLNEKFGLTLDVDETVRRKESVLSGRGSRRSAYHACSRDCHGHARRKAAGGRFGRASRAG